MNKQAKTRRRWFGAICLTLAIVMLIAGETVLKDRLSVVGFFCYWMACFVLTALAAGAAVIDAARVRNELRGQQRSLIEETLQQVEREKRSRKDSKQ